MQTKTAPPNGNANRPRLRPSGDRSSPKRPRKGSSDFIERILGGGQGTKAMPALDLIHILFLLYSAAHNFVNAWHSAENILFFVFVAVGILSVELMLLAIYRHWKDGRLVGKMQRIAMAAGFIAMFYATAGILAQAQAGGTGEWLSFYYQWILPTSAPVMFFYAFWIQADDPVSNTERDAIAYALLVRVEEKKEGLDRKKLALRHRRGMRKLQSPYPESEAGGALARVFLEASPKHDQTGSTNRDAGHAQPAGRQGAGGQLVPTKALR